MGRATIAGNLGKGRYLVNLDYGTDIIAQRVADLDALIAKTEADKTESESRLEQAEVVRQESIDAVNQAIDAYKQAVEADPSNADQIQPLTAASTALALANKDVAIATLEVQQIEFSLAELQKEKAAILAVKVEDSKLIWCADYTLDASGDVATCEVPGEPAQIIMAPGARTPTVEDGALFARGVMSPAQAYFNAAILPGWQKFKPTYRTGVITDIDYAQQLCNVNLNPPTESTAQSLLIDQEQTLIDVPIEYMTHGAIVFEDGDIVLVQFNGQQWQNRKVIGFASNPKIPTLGAYLAIGDRRRGFIGTDGEWRFGAISANSLYNSQMTDWRDESRGVSVQWNIKNTRYGNMTGDSILDSTRSAYIFSGGQAIAQAPNLVHGAAINKNGDLLCITQGQDMFVAQAWRKKKDEEWALLGQIDLYDFDWSPDTLGKNTFKTSWFFNPDGDKAVCTCFLGWIWRVEITGDSAVFESIRRPSYQSSVIDQQDYCVAVDYDADGNMIDFSYNWKETTEYLDLPLDWPAYRKGTVQWMINNEVVLSSKWDHFITLGFNGSAYNYVFDAQCTNAVSPVFMDLRFGVINVLRVDGQGSSDVNGVFTERVTHYISKIQNGNLIDLVSSGEIVRNPPNQEYYLSMRINPRPGVLGVPQRTKQRAAYLTGGSVEVFDVQMAYNYGSYSVSGRPGSLPIAFAEEKFVEIESNFTAPEFNLKHWAASPATEFAPIGVIYNVNVV